MADDRIEIEVVLDDGSVKKGFAKIKSEGDKLGKGLGSKRGLGGAFAGISNSIKGIGASLAGLGPLLAGVGAGLFFRSITQAAEKQEEAVNNLNTALRLAGTFSEEASIGIQRWAAELQKATTIGDEAAIEAFNLARAFTKTNEEATQLTEAALELSAGVGISLESATRNLGKSFGGLLGELGEILPALRTLTQEELKAGKALEFVLDRFGGAAAAQVNTFSGATQRLSNNFGDLLEAFGDFLIKSPAFNSAIKGLSDALGSLADAIKPDIATQFQKQLGSLSKTANTYLIEVNKLEEAQRNLNEEIGNDAPSKVQQSRLNILNLQLQTNQKAYDGILKRIVELRKAETARLRDQKSDAPAIVELTKQQLAQRAALQASFNQMLLQSEGAAIQARLNLIKDDPSTGATIDRVKLINDQILLLNNQFREQEATLQKQFLTDNVISQGEFNELLLQKRRELNANIEILSREQEAILDKTATAQGEKFKEISKAVIDATNNFLSRGIAGGVQSVVKALLTGQNAFEAFKNQLLSIAGDIAIQLGQFLIATGIGIEKLKAGLLALAGGFPIAAGVALIAIGTLLKSVGGAGVSAISGSGGPDDSFAQVPESAAPSVVEDTAEPGTAVNINVEGTVLDPRGVGLQIANILEDTFRSNGVKVITA